MNVLKQNKFEEVKCDLYDPDGEFLWTISSIFELNDVRIQIKRNKLKHYYLSYKEKQNLIHLIEISNEGRLEYWPERFYDTYDKQLDELLD